MKKRMQNLECKVQKEGSLGAGRGRNAGHREVGKRATDKETKQAGGKESKAGTNGQNWAEKRVDLGKGGKMKGKWTGFSHLCPDDSMQVVDFPLLSRLRVFWLRVERGGGQWTVDNWQWIANSGNESNRTNGTNSATERSLMFAYVRVKSLMFAFFEKKYFFPALWPLAPRTQWVGGDEGRGWIPA